MPILIAKDSIIIPFSIVTYNEIITNYDHSQTIFEILMLKAALAKIIFTSQIKEPGTTWSMSAVLGKLPGFASLEIMAGNAILAWWI